MLTHRSSHPLLTSSKGDKSPRSAKAPLVALMCALQPAARPHIHGLSIETRARYRLEKQARDSHVICKPPTRHMRLARRHVKPRHHPLFYVAHKQARSCVAGCIFRCIRMSLGPVFARNDDSEEGGIVFGSSPGTAVSRSESKIRPAVSPGIGHHQKQYSVRSLRCAQLAARRHRLCSLFRIPGTETSPLPTACSHSCLVIHRLGPMHFIQ